LENDQFTATICALAVKNEHDVTRKWKWSGCNFVLLWCNVHIVYFTKL